MLNKEHNTLEGIQKTVNIRASLNTGLSNDLKEAFPMTIPATLNLESSIKNNNLHPEWVAGFSTGESNFFIAVQKSKTNSGLSASLRFSIAQHSRDLLLLESFVIFFRPKRASSAPQACWGGGSVMNYKKRSVCEFIITKIDHIVEHIIPLFW